MGQATLLTHAEQCRTLASLARSATLSTLARAEYLKATAFDPENPFYLNKTGMHFKKWDHSIAALGYFEKASRANVHVSGPTDFARENIRAIREYLDEK